MSVKLQFILAAMTVLFAVLSQAKVRPPRPPICSPKCSGGPHDVCKSCASACPLTCANPNPGICTLQCIVNQCECESGYVRNEQNGQCIKPEECPEECPTNCTGGPHDKCRSCASVCEPTCKIPNPHICPPVCNLDPCECEKGYVRAPSGQCILFKHCPKNSTKYD